MFNPRDRIWSGEKNTKKQKVYVIRLETATPISATDVAVLCVSVAPECRNRTLTSIILLPGLCLAPREKPKRRCRRRTEQLFTHSVVVYAAHIRQFINRALLAPCAGFRTTDSHDRRSTGDPPPPHGPPQTTRRRRTARGERRSRARIDVCARPRSTSWESARQTPHTHVVVVPVRSSFYTAAVWMPSTGIIFLPFPTIIVAV